MTNVNIFLSLFSVNEMMVKWSQVILATLSRLIAAKMEEPILHVEGWINGRIAIAVARSYSRMLCGDWVPNPLQTRYPPGSWVWDWYWRNKFLAPR